MKQKKSEVIYTPNWLFSTKMPLGWNDMAKRLTIAIDKFNRRELVKWKESPFIVRIFSRPAKYKVAVEATGIPEMMKLYPETNHHRIWIENTRKKRMHFDILCRKQLLTNSMFLQNGVKYDHFLLMTKDTSTRWLNKKYLFLHKVIHFIQREVS